MPRALRNRGQLVPVPQNAQVAVPAQTRCGRADELQAARQSHLVNNISG